MTWGEFKKLVEKRGTTDETEIDYIDIGSQCAERIDVKIDDEGVAVY